MGAPFQATNGILQGCPISVALLNALASIWSRAVAHETEATPRSYADDQYALAASPGPIEKVLELNWGKDLFDLKVQSAATGKPILYLQALGNLSGYA